MMGGAMDDETAETNLHRPANTAAVEGLTNKEEEDTSTLTGDTRSTTTLKAKQIR